VRSDLDVEPASTFDWRRASRRAYAAFVLVFGALSLARFETFHSRSLDMAYYVRLVWGLGHGHLDHPVVDAPHVLGLHLEIVLLPLAGLGRLGIPIPELLLVVQVLAAGAVIFPAVALARRHLGPVCGERMALATALIAFLLPTVSRCVDYDFHPATMAIWPLLALVDALDEGRWPAAAAWFALALACREDVGLQVGCVAATLIVRPLRPGERGRAAALLGVGFAWFFAYALLVQPAFLPPSGSFTLHFGRFASGGGTGAILRGIFAEPVELARYLVSDDRMLYPVLLLLQVALLPVIAPRYLAGVLPLFAINLLSDFPNVRGVAAHYITAGAPFLTAAALLGAAHLGRLWWDRVGRAGFAALPAGAALMAAAIAFLLRGTSPLSPEWRLEAYLPDEHYDTYRAIVARTPPDAEVSANVRLLAHLAERKVARIGSETGPPEIRPTRR
jgi:uncharacterized membrane protein